MKDSLFGYLYALYISGYDQFEKIGILCIQLAVGIKVSCQEFKTSHFNIQHTCKNLFDYIGVLGADLTVVTDVS